MIEENPYVDEVWEIPIPDRSQMDRAWVSFEKAARTRLKKGEFSKIFLTQINPANYQNFDGTVRSSIFRGYPRPITVSIQPVLRLRSSETENVRRFAEEWKLGQRDYIVLFECASSSGQSFVTPSYAVMTARLILERHPNAAIILSSNASITSGDGRIIDGSRLTLRENAELTKYCHLIVGCSSGVSWICTSEWAKPLPFIQVLRGSTSVFASMFHDAEYFHLPTDHILEMTDCAAERLADCIVTAIHDGFGQAKKNYHEIIPVKLTLYLEGFMKAVIRGGHLIKCLVSISHVLKRYGIKPFIDYFEELLNPA